MGDNKEKILLYALELFGDKGYDAVGVQEIVQKAGVTKPTLYHYFGSKEGLLGHLLNDNHDNMMTYIGEAAFYNGDLPLTICKLTHAYFDYARMNRRFYRLLAGMRFYPPCSEPYKIAKPLIAKQLELLKNMFLAASKDHGNMKGRENIYAVTYLGMINAYIELIDEDISENSDLMFKAIHQFMHGIYS